MTAPLTLDEFTAALRAAFPDGDITKAGTLIERLSQWHGAVVTLHGHGFEVHYGLNPMDESKRWRLVWSDHGDVATARELRPFMAAQARRKAKLARRAAREASDRAKAFVAAAKLIEASL